MAKYYIFVCEENDNYITYFNEQGYKTIHLNSMLQEKITDNSIIIYNTNELEVTKIINSINIYLIDSPILNLSKIQQISFDYYIPTHQFLFFTYVSKLSFKLLPPIKQGCSYYCDINTHKKYCNLIKGNYTKECTTNIDAIIYDNINELSYIPRQNYKVKFFNIDNKINNFIFDINNYFSFANKSNEVIIPRMSTSEYNLIVINSYLDNNDIEFEKNKVYLITRKGTVLLPNLNIYINVLIEYGFTCCSFLINNICDNEICIFYKSFVNAKIKLFDLFSKIEYHDTRFAGTNTIILNDNESDILYYYYGKNKMYHVYKHLCNYEYVYYECIINFVLDINTVHVTKFNKNKFRRILSFWSGINSYSISNGRIDEFIKNNFYLFDQETYLLLSKSITDYGGNQKTGLQIYNDLISYGYDVKVCCLTKDELVNTIDKYDILKLNNINDVLHNINNTNYKLIIVNKLDEFFKIVDKVNKESIFISHNSMDPVNRQIIEKNNYLKKIFTVNSEHINLLLDNNVICRINKYINHINISKNQIIKRKNFKNNIVYIGRISKEKNIDMLINSFHNFSNKNIELIIIGDGKMDFKPIPNITFLGRCDTNTMIYYLMNTDYLILPSMVEGLPFVCIEAMSFGIPVITSDIIGCNEIVEDGKRGFLFKYDNYNDYKNTIDSWKVMEYIENNKNKFVVNLINVLEKAYSIDIEKWNELSQNCYEYIKNNYDSTLAIKKNILSITKLNQYAIICSGDICNETLSNFKYFDIYKNNSFEFKNYKVIININKSFYFKINVNYFLKKINKIYCEMNNKKINKIEDNYGNFILSINCFNNVLHVCSIYDLII